MLRVLEKNHGYWLCFLRAVDVLADKPLEELDQ